MWTSLSILVLFLVSIEGMKDNACQRCISILEEWRTSDCKDGKCLRDTFEAFCKNQPQGEVFNHVCEILPKLIVDGKIEEKTAHWILTAAPEAVCGSAGATEAPCVCSQNLPPKVMKVAKDFATSHGSSLRFQSTGSKNRAKVRRALTSLRNRVKGCSSDLEDSNTGGGSGFTPYHLMDVVCSKDRPEFDAYKKGAEPAWTTEPESTRTLVDWFGLRQCTSDAVPPFANDDAWQSDVIQMTSPTTACHPESIALRELCKADGNSNYEEAGGKGLSNRVKAAQLINRKFSAVPENGVICQVKGTAETDGHSFSIVAMPRGNGDFPNVQVLEGWAGEYFTSTCALPRSFEYVIKAGNYQEVEEEEDEVVQSAKTAEEAMTPSEAAGIVLDFANADEHARTAAYQSFTRSGYEAIDFEWARGEKGRAEDGEISLKVFCNDMAPREVINARMEDRRKCGRGIIRRALETYAQYTS